MSEVDTARRKEITDILKYACKAVFIAILLIVLKMLFEHSSWGHRVEIFAFEFLQGQMLQFSSANRLPVLVVDMSDIPGGKDQVTPRKPLRDFIEAISKFRPRAIAIDIDFSPEGNWWKDDGDPQFFDFCLHMMNEKKIPIFLGVNRTRGASPKQWLGLEKYRELASDLWLPHEVLKVPFRPEASHEFDLPTLSASLAGMNRKSHNSPEPPTWLRFALEYPRNETLVNYSKLDQMKHETIPLLEDPKSVEKFGKRLFFTDKMVVIGDATLAMDHRNVPGRFETVQGVYVHACAAYTLAVEPLYELSAKSKFLADLAIALGIILTVASIRYRHIGENADPGKLESKWIWRAVILVLVAGILLVRCGKVMWLDFFLVIFALFLHPSVDEWLKDLWKKRKA